MATTIVAVGDSAYPTPDEVHSIILRTIAFDFNRRGLVASVLPGSDHFIRAEAYARRVSVAIANGRLALADVNPLTAQGQALVDLAAVFGVNARPAAGAAGPVAIKCSGTVVLPAGFPGTAPSGLKYQVIATTTLTTGQTVDVSAVSTGKATDVDAGIKITWDSAAIGNLDPVATVAAGGITGGNDGDVVTNADGTLNVEQLRNRLLRKLSSPPVGGNWSSVVQWAEEATSSVAYAVAYPAAQGPASYDLAIVGSASRVLTAPIIALVAAYINSLMPGQNKLNVTSVVEQEVDVTVVASLPLPAAAGGAGGGWRDANPWPSGQNVRVFGYNATTLTATVDGTISPVVGQQIGIWNPNAIDSVGNPAPAMVEYIIATVGGVSNAYTITVQGGFQFNPIASYVSTGAVHLVEYAADLYTQFQALGPGEKTDSPDRLPLARRQPTTDIQAPSNMSSLLLSKVTNLHPEIADLTYGVRYLAGTTTPITGPELPLAVADPPNIIALKRLAIRA